MPNYHTYQDTLATGMFIQRQAVGETWQLVGDFLDFPEGWLGTQQIRYRGSLDIRISHDPDSGEYLRIPQDEWFILTVVNGHTQTYVRADSGTGTVSTVVEGRVSNVLPSGIG